MLVWSLKKHIYDLPFTDTTHLRNPLNENKPVKVGRDCQEIERPVAEQLCTLIDEGAAGLERKRLVCLFLDSC